MTAGRRPTAEHPGEVIVRADVGGTLIFALTAVYAAVSFSTAAQWVGAITAMTLFVVGVAAFLWAFYNAVRRSRVEQISVTQLFFLLGAVAPPRVRRTMLAMVAIQFAVALATTLARPDGPDGAPGSSLAVGFLVAMFGFGLNGLWAAYHGSYQPRDDGEQARRPSIGKNERHG